MEKNKKTITQKNASIILDTDVALKLLQKVYCYTHKGNIFCTKGVDFMNMFVDAIKRNNIKIDKEEEDYVATLQAFLKTAPPFYTTPLQSLFECYNETRIDMLRNKINKIKAAL